MLRRSVTSLSRSLAKHPRRPASSLLLKSLTTTSNPFYSNKKTPHFHPPTSLNPTTHLRNGQNLRQYSVDTSKEVDEINLKFAEAREEIDMAMDSKDTVYFNEEAECARDAVKEVLDMYESLLAKLPEKEKEAIQRSMGLKMEQLKAELQQLNE